MISGGLLILFLFCGIIVYKSRYRIPLNERLEKEEFNKEVDASRKELPSVEYPSFNEAVMQE